MAGEACHGFGSTTQVGLTQALGPQGGDPLAMQDQLTFWLTILGFLLSVIAAWSTLSKWGASLRSVSFGFLKRYLDSNQAKLELAGNDAGYLVAFITRNLLFVVFLWMGKYAMSPYVAASLVGLVSKAIPVATGVLVGSVLSTCSIIVFEKRRQYRPRA